jgi:hypothetical protein
MTPISLLAAQTLAAKLTSGDALAELVSSMASDASVTLPPIAPEQILLSSAPVGLADNNAEFTYPRVCIYSTGLKNTGIEKFRTVSGEASVAAEIWASGDLISDVDNWIHFYVEAVTAILRSTTGDWGNGLSFWGVYEIQFQPPKIGGLGFVQSAKVTFDLAVSLS